MEVRHDIQLNQVRERTIGAQVLPTPGIGIIDVACPIVRCRVVLKQRSRPHTRVPRSNVEYGTQTDSQWAYLPSFAIDVLFH